MPNQTIVFYFTLSSSILALPFVLPNWSWPSSQTWLPLLGVGVLAYIGQLKLTSAFIKAPASLVSNFGYLNVVFAALWGLIFWREKLGWQELFGASIIIFIRYYFKKILSSEILNQTFIKKYTFLIIF